MSSRTLRQAMAELLTQKEMSISLLAKEFQTKFSEIESALEHVEKSIKPKRIRIRPARCKQCGFVFKDRTKFTPPSRCPECKSEWIEEATFKIG